MKRLVFSFCRVFFVITLLCFAQCKKEHKPVTITLYDKPLAVIQSHIQGKWKLHYGKGGIIANYIQYFQNAFWEFKPGNRIKTTNTGIVIADTTIEWNKDLGVFVDADSTFTMKFYDKIGYPTVLVPDKIYNDTLIFHDYSSDAMFYHLTRLN